MFFRVPQTLHSNNNEQNKVLIIRPNTTCTSCTTAFWGARGGAVVEALRYTPEGRGIDSRWC
jgi:hypothetical protein